MDWVKLLTEFDGNPKILSVGLAGAGLYARSLAYCGKYETDGFIPDAWVSSAIGPEDDPELPKHLLSVGLWKRGTLGFYIPDYTDVNRTKSQFRRLRAARSRAGKKGGSKTGSKTQASASALVLSNSHSDSPSPSPSVSGSKDSARATVNRKLVSDSELELAIGIIDEFNVIAATNYTPSAHLTPVVGRIREHPELDLAEHRKIIEASFRDPWWDGHPSPSVIYGNAALFEKQMENRNPPPQRRSAFDREMDRLAAEEHRLRQEEQHGAI